jgi:hypothetical protein
MMKIVGLVFLLVAATASAQTNHVWAACRHPIRVFGYGEAVNLMPLFEWWQHQPLRPATNRDLTADAEAGDARPLVAWHRITGVKIGDTGNSWLVNAMIYTSPTIHTNARIILNDPPIGEEQSYYALQTRLASTDQQLAVAQRAYRTATNAEMKAENRAESYRHSWSKVAPTGVQQYSEIAARRRLDASAAIVQQRQLDATRAEIQKQLSIIPAANGRYVIDLFAMARGTDKKGVLIYDAGVVNPGSP